MLLRTVSPLAVLLLGPALAGCVSVHTRHYETDRPPSSLGRLQVDDGTYEDCSLNVHGGGNASLDVSREVVHTEVHLGLTWRELDRDTAEQRGVRPFQGLLITAVDEGSAAATAGVQVGDLLIKLAGEETIYQPRSNQIALALQPGTRVPAELIRGTDTPVTVEIEVRTKETKVTERESIPLTAPPTSEIAYAGFSLRGIPGEWSTRIFGEGNTPVVISGVDLGSPAWVAGLRAGDVIHEVDGQPTPVVEELVRVIQLRGAARQELPVVVRRSEPGEDFATTIYLHEFERDSDVHVPLIFRVQNDVVSDRVTLGPLGLIATSESEYLDSTSREVQSKSSFSMILGLFKVTSKPRSTEIRLLWFISIDT